MYLKTVIISTFILLLGSCKYTCDEYPESERRWVPFSYDQKLRYTNQVDTIEFTITESYRNAESSVKGVFMDLECSYDAHYRTNEQSEISIFEENRIGYLGGTTTSFSKLDVFQYVLSDGFKNDSISVRLISDTIINEIQLNESYEVTKTEGGSSISEFIKSSDKGVVLFHDNSNSVTWYQLE